jgi:hypothetical protein
MMREVEFGDLPPVKASTSTAEYEHIASQLRQRPGSWAKIAVVDSKRDLYRWNAAMKTRNIRFKQRYLEDGTWAVWCMAPDGNV